ncbi:MAG: hypothetical protein WC835_00935 [Candidatus Paceibacterota bacterium]|jgi:hypothetical protein
MSSLERFPQTDPAPDKKPGDNNPEENLSSPAMPGDRELAPEERARLAEVLKRAKKESEENN